MDIKTKCITATYKVELDIMELRDKFRNEETTAA